MKRTEKRDVEVKYCDICGEESEHLYVCPVCKREICNKGGGVVHNSFSVETYEYGSGDRLSNAESRICKECAGKVFEGTIGELLIAMMSPDPVPVK